MVRQCYYQNVLYVVLTKSRFIKQEEEAKVILSTLGLKTALSKIPLSGDILLQHYKMNEIINKFLLAGDKFMPETHLK